MEILRLIASFGWEDMSFEAVKIIAAVGWALVIVSPLVWMLVFTKWSKDIDKKTK